MKCVSYVRYSSCRQEKETPADVIRQQNERIRSFIRKKGWELTEKYSDRKRDKEAEEAFQQMRLDGIDRKFELVVIDSIFRCGKNVPLAEDVLLKSFYPAGIHFAVVEDDLCSIDMTKEEAEDYFRKKKHEYMGSVMVSKARQKQAEGYLSVHDEKYGYLLHEERKELIIDEEAAEAVRHIFKLLAEEGMTYKQTAVWLDGHGYETPMKHMARVGKKNIPSGHGGWAVSTVKRIAENTAYIGYWYKMVDGKRTKLITPPIITQEQFQKAAGRLAKAPGKSICRGNRSENAFVRQIFDRDTGAALLCRLRSKREPYQVFCKGFWDADSISYDYVMQEAVAAVRREQKKAQLAMRYLCSGGAFEKRLQEKARLSEQAGGLFKEMAAIERLTISLYQKKEDGGLPDEIYKKRRAELAERFAALEEQFSQRMEREEKLETAYSSRNPWGIFYSGISIPDVLTKEQVRKWIDRIYVKDLKTIEVILPPVYTEWRDLLPEIWFEEET